MGKVSKSILSRIVTSLRERTKLNQWKNSFSVIDWFKKLNNKETLSFLLFVFCPNITEDLLKKALEYAKNHVNISPEEVKIILQTKKAFLFADKKPWIKKGNKVFDVTMGSWDGAEVAELVGLYLLSQLTDLSLDVGLYRNDGLGVCKLPQGKQNITAEANLKTVNFLWLVSSHLYPVMVFSFKLEISMENGIK